MPHIEYDNKYQQLFFLKMFSVNNKALLISHKITRCKIPLTIVLELFSLAALKIFSSQII